MKTIVDIPRPITLIIKAIIRYLIYRYKYSNVYIDDLNSLPNPTSSNEKTVGSSSHCHKCWSNFTSKLVNPAYM